MGTSVPIIYHLLIIVIVQMVVMICAIPFTEAALKRNFDDLGKHR